MTNLHFDTDPAWVDIIRTWAAEQEDIVVAWIFGSRVTGIRREKPNPSPVPDIDIAVQLAGASAGERLAQAFGLDEEGLCEQLPISVSIIPYDAEVGDEPVSWVLEHGVEIFRR